MKPPLPVSALALASLLAAPAFADKQEGDAHRRGNFVTEIRTTTDDGKVTQRRIEQKVQDGRLERRSETVAPDGRRATKTVTAVRDAETGAVHRVAEGTGFDGKTWRRESTHRRHDEGRPARHGKHGERKHHDAHE